MRKKAIFLYLFAASGVLSRDILLLELVFQHEQQDLFQAFESEFEIEATPWNSKVCISSGQGLCRPHSGSCKMVKTK